MDLKKLQKQGRDERMQEDYPTTEQWRKGSKKLPYFLCVFFSDVGYLFLHCSAAGLSSCVLSSLPGFCTFFDPSLLEMKFCSNFFPELHKGWTVAVCRDNLPSGRCARIPSTFRGWWFWQRYTGRVDGSSTAQGAEERRHAYCVGVCALFGREIRRSFLLV